MCGCVGGFVGMVIGAITYLCGIYFVYIPH
jgi:hypothetical protein